MISGRSDKDTWSIRSRKSGQIGYMKSHFLPNFFYVQFFSTFFHSEKSFRLNDVRKRSVEILFRSDDFLKFVSFVSIKVFFTAQHLIFVFRMRESAPVSKNPQTKHFAPISCIQSPTNNPAWQGDDFWNFKISIRWFFDICLTRLTRHLDVLSSHPNSQAVRWCCNGNNDRCSHLHFRSNRVMLHGNNDGCSHLQFRSNMVMLQREQWRVFPLTISKQ